MSGIRDVVARIAADPSFAQYVRSSPDEVARQYGLGADEIEKVLGLAEAESSAGPAPLGPRLSRSGVGAGGVLSLLSSLGEAADQTPAVTPGRMVPPGDSYFQSNVDPTDHPNSDDDLTGPSVKVASAGPEPHLDVGSEAKLPGDAVAVDLEVLPPPDSSDGAPVDQVAINFTKIEFEHPQQESEKGKGNVRTAMWDLTQAKDS